MSRTTLLLEGKQSHKVDGYVAIHYRECFYRNTCIDREVRGNGQLSLIKSVKALEEEAGVV